MSEALRKAWAEGSDVRDVIAMSVEKRFFDIVNDDNRKEKEERIAANPKARSRAIKEFSRFLGIGKPQTDRYGDKILPLSKGALARIKELDATDLNAFRMEVKNIFTPSTIYDDRATRILKSRLGILALSTIEHFEDHPRLMARRAESQARDIANKQPEQLTLAF